MSTSTEETNLVLPETFQAPDLRHLSLQGVGLPRGLPLLFSATALSTLFLTDIQAFCYFPPGHLVTQVQGLPRLEELSIGFAIPIPLPNAERELLSPLVPPVTLPNLRRLTFRGVGVYLNNLIAQINTPLLEILNLILLFELTFTLVNLTAFFHRTEGFRCLVSRVIFNKDGVSIDAGYYEQQGTRKLNLRVNCEPLDWQIDSATQVCSALGEVLSTVEELTLNLDTYGMPSDWEGTLDSIMWHELLLQFIRVKKLHVGSSLTLELSRALQSGAGGLFLPELQELEVSLKIDHATTVLTIFLETRESEGRPVHLLVPPGDEVENISARCLQNTLAERRSRRRELEYQRGLEDAIDAAREEKERWQARALALEELLRDLGQN